MSTFELPVRRLWWRQTVVGLLMLPLSMLPFMAYFALTPEGHLLWRKAVVSFVDLALPPLPSPDTLWILSHRPRYQGAVAVLVYHGIGTSPDGDGDGGQTVSEQQFGEHLAALNLAGMTPITAAEMARACQEGTPLPDNAVMITFDDGRAEAMLYADPLLEEADMKATMFVIGSAADKPGVFYASWSALEDYAASGRWDLESHTQGLHFQQQVADGQQLPALTSLAPGETPAGYVQRVRTDLEEEAAALEAHAGHRPVAFAYPFGAHGAERTNDPRIEGLLRAELQLHAQLAFHQDEQDSVPLATCDDDLLGLRRLDVDDWSGRQLVDQVGQMAARTPALIAAAGGDDSGDLTPKPGAGASTAAAARQRLALTASGVAAGDADSGASLDASSLSPASDGNAGLVGGLGGVRDGLGSVGVGLAPGLPRQPPVALPGSPLPAPLPIDAPIPAPAPPPAPLPPSPTPIVTPTPDPVVSPSPSPTPSPTERPGRGLGRKKK